MTYNFTTQSICIPTRHRSPAIACGHGRTHARVLWQKPYILAGCYRVSDVVFPKHGPTFRPRLWSSMMLLRGGTRGSTVRGNILINHRTTTMGHCQAISTSRSVAFENHQYDRTHGFATETWDLEWDPLSITIPILSHDQSQRLLPNSNQLVLSAGNNASGRSCMHEANPCAQLYRFKMAPGYPGIHGLFLRIVFIPPLVCSSNRLIVLKSTKGPVLPTGSTLLLRQRDAVEFS